MCLFWFELRTTIRRPIIRVTTQNRTLPLEGTYHYDGVESKKESNLPFSQHRKQINHSDMSHLVNKLDQPHRVKKQCTSNLLQVIPLAINASRKFVDNNVYMSARQYYACILFFFRRRKIFKKMLEVQLKYNGKMPLLNHNRTPKGSTSPCTCVRHEPFCLTRVVTLLPP